MAGNAKVNGTNYTVSAGNVKVNATNYGIAQGNAKVNGTNYAITFGPLPAGYTQLEYLYSSNGNPYINAPMPTGSGCKVRIVMAPQNTATGTAFHIFGLNYASGATTDQRKTTCAVSYQRTASAFQIRHAFYNQAFTNTVSNGTVGAQHDITVIFGGNNIAASITIDGSTATDTARQTAVTATTGPNRLFRITYGGTWATAPSCGYCNIYLFEGWNASGTKVCEMYPCRRDSDNKLGMFNLTNNTFYEELLNSSSGDGFTPGPAV